LHLFQYSLESQHKKAALEKRLLPALSVLTKVYDFMTLPVYAAVQQPWKKIALHNSIKVSLVNLILATCHRMQLRKRRA